jgi:hypothetical protein
LPAKEWHVLCIRANDPQRYFDGLTRRRFLRAGLAGFGGLGLADLLRLRAQAAEAGSPRRDTACILVWLDGGPSHVDTYDLKPDAPAEYRSLFLPIRTKGPSMHVCELLPRHAQVADKFTLIRSCSHNIGDHADGARLVLSGRPPPVLDLGRNRYPDLGSVVKWSRSMARRGLPSYVGIPARQESVGPGYLGKKYEPFEVRADPNAPNFQVPNLSLPDGAIDRLNDRVVLHRLLDNLRRELDLRGVMEAMDSYNQEAVGLLTGDEARKAFDLSRVDPRERERYGRSRVGQNLLLARRLVEAGIGFVHVDGRSFSDVAPGIQGDWDDHAVLSNIFEAMQKRLPWYDQAVAALIEDLYQRGLDKKVLVVVTGEFGRTPQINLKPSRFTGVVQPGREHWPLAMSILVSGGGLRMGQVIGSTTSRGETPKDRPLRPTDLLATVYHFLGIDTSREYQDHSGRPLAILPDGAPISELL